MKNTLILIALTFATCGLFAQTGTQESGFAQAAPQEIKPVRLGFVAAPAFTWLSAENKELDSKGVRAGFAFGVLVDFTIAQSENYSFSTGLMMNMQDGGKLKYYSAERLTNDPQSEAALAYNDVNINMQYLEVPMTLKLKTNQIGYMTYFGQLGLRGGVKLSAKENGDYEFVNKNESVRLIDQENINRDTQLFNAGMLVGIGTEYNISGNTNLVFGINYFHGFTNVLRRNIVLTEMDADNNLILATDENDEILTGSKRNAVLRSISLSVGVIF